MARQCSQPSASYHSGQLCAAETRVFVQEGIHDKFLEQLVGAVRTLKRCDHPFGDPSEGIHTPIISKAQYEVRTARLVIIWY